MQTARETRPAMPKLIIAPSPSKYIIKTETPRIYTAPPSMAENLARVHLTVRQEKLPRRPVATLIGIRTRGNYAAICSIKFGSSLGARELFTRLDTGHTCK
jgi:hypothetical protein